MFKKMTFGNAINEYYKYYGSKIKLSELEEYELYLVILTDHQKHINKEIKTIKRIIEDYKRTK